MDVREKLEVIAHLGAHITYKEDIGICYDSELARVIEDAYMEIKNGVTVQEDCKACAEATQNCIVKLQEQIAELRSVQEWISVKDRLPESNKIVLASAVSKTFGYRHTLMVAHIGHHEATTEDDGWRECEVDTEYDEEMDCFWIPECWWEVNSVEDNGNWIIDSDYEVTHWMPLPQPPKGD